MLLSPARPSQLTLALAPLPQPDSGTTPAPLPPPYSQDSQLTPEYNAKAANSWHHHILTMGRFTSLYQVHPLLLLLHLCTPLSPTLQWLRSQIQSWSSQPSWSRHSAGNTSVSWKESSCTDWRSSICAYHGLPDQPTRRESLGCFPSQIVTARWQICFAMIGLNDTPNE